MKTMSGGPCLHYDCSNRNSFGYCKTTVCINEHYQLEQLGLPSTTNKSESVVIKQRTNADRLRAMTDEELAKRIAAHTTCMDCINLEKCNRMSGRQYVRCEEMWLDWLRQEVSE